MKGMKKSVSLGMGLAMLVVANCVYAQIVPPLLMVRSPVEQGTLGPTIFNEIPLTNRPIVVDPLSYIPRMPPGFKIVASLNLTDQPSEFNYAIACQNYDWSTALMRFVYTDGSVSAAIPANFRNNTGRSWFRYEMYFIGTHWSPPGKRVCRIVFDGVFDGLITGCNIRSTELPQDTDNDGMSDIWENLFSGCKDRPDNDYDKDELTNLDEYTRGTNPYDADTDDDHMTDGWEVQHAWNPLVSDANVDTDGDGVMNDHEVVYFGTSPAHYDTEEFWYVKADYLPPYPNYTRGSRFNPFTSIQEALSQMTDGQTLHLYPGVYKEAVKLYHSNRAIEGTHTNTVNGIRRPAAIIDATGKGAAGILAQWRNTNIVIRNLQVRGADGAGEDSGAGLCLSGCSNIVLSDVVALSNATHGLAAFNTRDLRIERSTASYNRKSGINLWRASATIEFCLAETNREVGFRLWEADNTTLTDNESTRNGGHGILISGKTTEPTRNITVVGNDVNNNPFGITAMNRLENLSILWNDVIDNRFIGVYVAGDKATVGAMKYNNIWHYGNDLVRVDAGSTILDATLNYYGSANAAEFQSRLRGNFVWSPHATSEFDTVTRILDDN